MIPPQAKKGRMVRVCGAHAENEKFILSFGRKFAKEDITFGTDA
jgi:hypothetical protein